MHAYLYDFVPDGPVADSVPESGMLVMPTGQELGFGGMDGQPPELVSVTLQRTKTQELWDPAVHTRSLQG